MQGDPLAPQGDEWIKIQAHTFINWVNLKACRVPNRFLREIASNPLDYVSLINFSFMRSTLAGKGWHQGCEP